MEERRTVEVHIAGQKYRVVSSATEAELHHLAAIVTCKLDQVANRGQPAHALVLAAIALAHEAEAERNRRSALEERTRRLLERVLGRIDDALAASDESNTPMAPERFT